MRPKIVFILFHVISLTYAFEDCGSKPGSLTSVSVSDCNEDEICILQKKTAKTIEITFTNANSNSVTSKVFGILGGQMEVPFPLSNPDACQESGISCPISSDNTYTYQTSLYVYSSYPSISLKVKWQLVDDDGNDIVCVEIPAKIKT